MARADAAALPPFSAAELQDLLPGIINQLGPDSLASLTNLKRMVAKEVIGRVLAISPLCRLHQFTHRLSRWRNVCFCPGLQQYLFACFLFPHVCAGWRVWR